MKGGITIKDRCIETILGIKVDSIDETRVLKQIQKWLGNKNGGRQRIVVTPNPEIILLAQKDQALFSILNSADLSLPDGIGVVKAKSFLKAKAPKNVFLRSIVLFFKGLLIGLSTQNHVVPGRVVFQKLLMLARRHKWRVFLLGGSRGSVENLVRSYQDKIAIKGTGAISVNQAGFVPKGQGRREKAVIEQIRKFKPDLLFVGFGAPKQEKWLARNIKKLPVRVGMVVGGAFDYYGGRRALPPYIFEKLGLEWLWRFITQPWRARRIFNAVIVFPAKIYLYKLLCSD